MKWQKFRGISDRALNNALAQHAGGLNGLMQWAVVIEKERRWLKRGLWVFGIWAVTLTAYVVWG